MHLYPNKIKFPKTIRIGASDPPKFLSGQNNDISVLKADDLYYKKTWLHITNIKSAASFIFTYKEDK